MMLCEVYMYVRLFLITWCKSKVMEVGELSFVYN